MVETNPWPQKLVDAVKAIVAIPGEFECDPSGGTRVEWRRRLGALNDERVSLPAALSIARHSQRHRREERRRHLECHPEIVTAATDRYRTGDAGVLELARELDAPPLALFKLMMAALGRDEVRPWHLGSRDLQQQIDARAHDCTERPEKDLLRAEALRFEDRVAEWLRRRRVPFQREEEQKEQQSRNTPDFLLPRAQKIPGLSATPVRWIEVKSYFGTRESLGEIQAQIRRYTRAYGTGVVIFRFGYEPGVATALGKKVHVAAMD